MIDPRLATIGLRVPIDSDDGVLTWTGTVVKPGGAADTGMVADGGITVLLAGEIYNRAHIVSALADNRLASGPDTELVLACWQRYGAASLRLFNGRFALVITEATRVIVATDHAGTVPLFLRLNGLEVEVSTEAKAMMSASGWSGPLEGASLLHAPSGLHRVPAGTGLIIGPEGSPTAMKTWAPPSSRTLVDARVAVDRVRCALTEAVVTRVAGDPDPTVVLSGGIDSGGVAALTATAAARLHSVSMGTDAGDEFAPARVVAGHVGSDHTEVRMSSADLIRELPWAIWAAEVSNPDVLEYLLPLVALYRRLEGAPRRILTGYGADIPLGGMHRITGSLCSLDDIIAHDMATFDGLHEMTPALSGIAGSWTTHPYWDRTVLELLVSLEPGLKLRHGRDKWVLREALADLLPSETVHRPKLGIHEGSGTTSTWTRVLMAEGVLAENVARVKGAMAGGLYQQLVVAGAHPSDCSFDDALVSTLRRQCHPVIP